MRYPTVGSTSKCPALSESVPCITGDNCHVYDWHWSSWGACVITKDTVCGQGIRLRYRECRRNGVEPVAKELCYHSQVCGRDIMICLKLLESKSKAANPRNRFFFHNLNFLNQIDMSGMTLYLSYLTGRGLQSSRGRCLWRTVSSGLRLVSLDRVDTV